MFKPNKEFDEARVAANRELAELIMDAVENNAGMRFSQLLEHIGIVKEHPSNPPFMCNDFYTEPQELLKRVKETMAGRKS